MNASPSLYAVIPAAGRGTRLGLSRPKILVELRADLSIWDVLAEGLHTFVDGYNVILSPDGEKLFRRALQERRVVKPVDITLQHEPKGMGHAIFCGASVWGKYDSILVIWGDQVNVSRSTLDACVTAHRNASRFQITLPVVKVRCPYVEYVFDHEQRLSLIRQSREGDQCSPEGLSDIGTFLLTTAGLQEAWEEYLKMTDIGAVTGELNFLPFLVHLSVVRGWVVRQVPINNPDESRGVNTLEDLKFFKKFYEAERRDQ